jgi:hypothetical protein
MAWVRSVLGQKRDRRMFLKERIVESDWDDQGIRLKLGEGSGQGS